MPPDAVHPSRELCAATDDGCACALLATQSQSPPGAGITVFVRGGSGKLATARIYDPRPAAQPGTSAREYGLERSGKGGFSVTEEAARAMIQAHFDASNVGAAGGAPGDDIIRASEIYDDDAVLEWPQGGERVRGKANIIAFRSTYPTRQRFEVHRITGCHDLWVNEYTILYDDRPVMAVGIMEFRDDKVVRERIYFGELWEPPEWRAQWVERFEL